MLTTIVDGLSFSESPRWHGGRLWFVDFDLRQVFSCDEDGGRLTVEAEVPQQPSGLGWLPDGRLLVVSAHDHRLLRREPDGTLVTHADLSGHLHAPVNDMVVDALGRAYVGNFGFDVFAGEPQADTVLLRVDPDGTVTVVADHMCFPNGSVVTPEGTLLVAETLAHRITAFDVAEDGTLSGRREWARLDAVPAPGGDEPRHVTPDGCVLDAEGCLWVADYSGGRVLRVREGGEVLEQLVVGSGVYACALGGADGRTLFVCSAGSRPGLVPFVRDGRISATKVAVGAA